MHGNTGSFLKDYASPTKVATTADDDDYQAFTFGRVGARSQAMLTFIKNDDYVEAISYANLNRIWTSNINRELKLDFGDRQVLIEGSNLKDLFRYISSNRCFEVREQINRTAMTTNADEPIVTRIDVSRSNRHTDG